MGVTISFLENEESHIAWIFLGASPHGCLNEKRFHWGADRARIEPCKTHQYFLTWRKIPSARNLLFPVGHF